ncbi:MAG: porin family protein [Bacteroidota bacterium]
MKIRISLFVVLSLLCSVLYAQKPSFGVHAISNFSFLELTEGNVVFDKRSDVKFGYGAGARLSFPLGEKFNIVTELNWIRKGGQYEFSFTDDNGIFLRTMKPKMNLDYLSVPLLMTISFGNKIIISPQIGSSVNFLIHQNYDYEVEVDGVVFYLPTYNDMDNFNRFDQTVLVGVDFSLAISEKMSAYLTMRGDIGFMEVEKDELILVGKNRSLVFLAGVRF